VEAAVLPQVPVGLREGALGVARRALLDVGPDDPAAVVDAEGGHQLGSGDAEPDEPAAIGDVRPDRRAVVDERGVVAVLADDLATVVDPDRFGARRARNVEARDAAAPIAEEPGLAVGTQVLAGDLTAVVDAGREEADARVRGVERAVAALVEDEPGQVRARRGVRVGGPRGVRSGEGRSRGGARDRQGSGADNGHERDESGAGHHLVSFVGHRTRTSFGAGRPADG
jgi:hypothetical protein